MLASRILRCGVFAFACLLLSGCAMSYTDEAGNRHVVGLMHLALPATDKLSEGSSGFRTTTVGVSFTQGDFGNAIALGYNETTLIGVGANSCLALKDLAFLHSSGEK